MYELTPLKMKLEVASSNPTLYASALSKSDSALSARTRPQSGGMLGGLGGQCGGAGNAGGAGGADGLPGGDGDGGCDGGSGSRRQVAKMISFAGNPSFSTLGVSRSCAQGKAHEASQQR